MLDLEAVLREGAREQSEERLVHHAIARRGLRLRCSERSVDEVVFHPLRHLRRNEILDDGLEIVVRRGTGISERRRQPGAIRPRVLYRGVGGMQGIAYPATGVSGVFDPIAKRAVWWLPDGPIPLAERTGPFRTILQWWLGREGLQIVHAAAVGTERGAALLVGHGGAGKSVTSLVCAGAGMRFLGDDSVLCDADELTVFTLYATATVYRQDVQRFGIPDTNVVATPDVEDKVVVDMSARTTPALPIRALVVPRATGATVARAQRISAASVLRAMAPSSLLNVPGADGEAFLRMSALARAIPSFEIELGADPAAIPEVVSRCIDQGCGGLNA